MIPQQQYEKYGELQYCSNNATTPGAPYFTFINPVVSNKLRIDGVVCTSNSSYYRLSLDQLAQVRQELKPTSMNSQKKLLTVMKES